jgi:hypothetical protein
MHRATHTRLRYPVSVERGSTGEADRHDVLAISLRKALFTRQETRHCRQNLRGNRPFPIDVVKISWLFFYIADRACCYLHGALVVESFQEALEGFDFTFPWNRVAPIPADGGRLLFSEGSLCRLEQLIYCFPLLRSYIHGLQVSMGCLPAVKSMEDPACLGRRRLLIIGC